MANITWSTPTSLQQLMNTVLTSLANNSLAISTETSGNMAAGLYNNTVALDTYADFQLVIEYNSGPPAAGTKVAELYLLPAVDGSNVASVDGTNQPQKSLLIATFESRAPSTSVVEYLVAPGIPLPPLKFKLVVKNTSGVTLKGGNVNFLNMQPYSLEIA